MNNKIKFIFLSYLGTALEYYDFIIYGMMTSYLTEVFFPDNAININLLKTFSILAIGYLARPLGGCIFGLLSDIHDRRRSLLFGMLIMAIVTTCIGILPSYSQAGIFSSVLLVICRFIQGLVFGAEMPNMTAIIKEYTPNKRQGKYFGWIISGTSLGALLATSVVFLIGKFFAHSEIIAWAWRIPFIIGSLLAFTTFFLRATLLEIIKKDDQNHEHNSSASVIKDLFKNHKFNLFRGIAITLFFAYLITFSLYMPVYFKQQFEFKTQTFFYVMTIGILLSAMTAPIFGYLGDRFNHASLLKLIPLCFLLFLSTGLQVLQHKSVATLAFFIFSYEIFIAAFSTLCLPVLANLFPTNVRATGIGLCYNLAFSLAALCPIILSYFVTTSNHIYLVSGLSGCIVITTVFASYLYQRSLSQNHQARVSSILY